MDNIYRKMLRFLKEKHKYHKLKRFIIEDRFALGSPIKGLVKRKNTSPIKKHICFSFTLSLLPASVLRC